MCWTKRFEMTFAKDEQLYLFDYVGIFPEPEHDPVIQIASMVIRQGEKEEFIKTVFTLGTCANIAGVGVIECKTEYELLEV